ncbi:MAG TPA: CopD family protein, partial [Acidimicrobiales bacterium]
SLGTQLAWRIVPLLAAGVLVGLAVRSPQPRRRRGAIGAAGIAGLAAMWGDVESSHASAAHSLRLLRMGDQWAHFAAAGVWVGGLAALLITVGAAARDERARAAARYSLAALCCVAVVAATGFQRGYDEIGSLHRLLHSGFGQYVLVKMALLGLVVGLGALNRYRSVPAVDRSPRLLQVVGRAELVLLTAVLAATGIIQGLAPPSSAAAPAVHPLVLGGHDFATTVRIKLAISPGTAGFNRFTLTVADYDTGAPVPAAASLGFTLPSRPDLGSSTLALGQEETGVLGAAGANLSINGTWTVVVTVQRPTGGVQIPFSVTPRALPQRIRVQPEGSLPTLYTLELPADQSVQSYLDPGHPGFDELHVTFVGAGGQELPMTALTVTATPPPGGAGPLTVRHLDVRRLDDIGHFVADIPGAVKGSYQLHVSGTAAAGATIEGTFTIPVK